MADAGTRIAALGVSPARAVAPLTVVEAYYDARLSEQLLSTAEGSLALAEWTLDQVERGRAEKLVAEFELLRARVARDNRRPAVVQRRVDRELAFLRLKQLLDLPGDTPLELTSPLGEAGPIPARLPATTEASPRRRAPVEQAALAIEAGEAGVELATSRHLPTVALGTTYGVVAYPDSALPSSADFNDGWTASVTVALPLFTGGAIRGGVIEAEAAVSASRARLRQIEEAARLDEARSRAALGAARATLEASVSTVEEARRARELAELRYREGLSTQLELSDATLLLSEAQVNRARAARDFQVARLRLELLPLLPLPGVEVTAPALSGGPDTAATPGGTGAGPGARGCDHAVAGPGSKACGNATAGLRALRLLPLLLASCGSNGGPPPPATAPLALGPELVARVTREPIVRGPRISGALEPARRAEVRAEVGGSVLTVSGELGQTVEEAEVLARVDAVPLRDAAVSAEAAAAAAREEAELARTQVARTERLVETGAQAEHQLELARNALGTASARLGEARAQLTAARDRLAAATVRAPFAGVIGVRAVNPGDVVAPGAPLFTVIDPCSVRLAAQVPTEEVAAVEVGAPVEFAVRRYPERTFTGSIEHVAPAADPVTRQLPILVTIPNPEGTLLAGLFAEGRIAASTGEGLVVPLAALDDSAAQAEVAVIRDGVVERIPVEVGTRDEWGERVEIRGGLREGEQVLTRAARATAAGTPVSLPPAQG